MWILISFFAGLFIFFIYSKFIINPSYTASVQLYVIANDSESAVNLTELNYAQKVVNTYINFLNTKVFYKKIQDDTKLDYSINQLKKMTSVKSINNTEIFQISVTSFSGEDSHSLAKSMEKNAPKLIKTIKPSAKISVVDPVNFPSSPSGPNIIRNSLIGGMLGLVAVVILIFLIEIFDTNIKNKEDIIENYRIPVLGEIPSFNILEDVGIYRRLPFLLKLKNKINNKTNNKTINKMKNKIKNMKKSENNQKNIKEIYNENIEFTFSESFKFLRTNLPFVLIKEGCKKIIISSSLPGDGKSTTSVNLGITLAQNGSRVLVIDCDLRKGKVHNFFNKRYKPGLSDALTGMKELEDVIVKTFQENLDIIPLGSLSPNPSELLSSSQMEKLLTRLEENYNYIIFDTPPVNILSDALSLVKYSDGLLIVVREGVTTHPNLRYALDKLKLSQGNILGIVLNDVSINQGKKFDYYYSYYGERHD